MRLNSYKNVLCLFLFIGLVKLSQAQDFSEVFQKVNNYYKTTNYYNIETTYTMYRGYTGKIITESYKGHMYKKKEVTGVTILGSEIITFPEGQITITDKSKSIIYINREKIALKNSIIDTHKLTKFYKQIAFKEDDNIAQYQFLLKNEVKNLPYNKLVFYINKSDNSILKQELFFTSKLPFTNKKGEREYDFGRMVIVYKVSNKLHKNSIKIEDYLIIDSNNKVSLTKAYKDYQLINQTPSN
ncbi:hypothetical protein [Olleya sp. HaHaR_3_96]|uniref:hypothetical protein n=1 Tax=Olleya sp. HaHaR_3_96 TaxID=2745560 RepID=UPI001C4EFF2A|nr:hypothetical protein [Olleya sp. HaHaR_3_96]QXP58413.1 hypothetical protein H0I26_10825 [Olleya sp. HaHaR_3_96]